MKNNINLLKLFFILFLVMLLFSSCLLKKLPKIAVIGGGIGGTSVSYFLYELFGPEGAHIDLYEPNKIGGRLSVIEVNGRSYEAGGSIIHRRNKYMVDFLKLLGLKKRETGNSRFGLYNGREFILTESNWNLITYAKLAWRYGFGPLKLQNYVDNLLNKFERIYSLQDNGNTFLSVTDLLNAMSPEFVKDLQATTKDGFIENGFSERIIDELIIATLTANYGQSTKVHEFVGSVSIAGAGGGLWSIHGGNKIVPQTLLQRSKATLIEAKVTNITLRPELDDMLIHYTNVENVGNKTSYDIVIVATPLAEQTHTGIKFNNFPREFKFPGRYHRTVCTILQGKLNVSYFGFKNEEDAVDEILTVKTGLEFNSMGRIWPVDYKKGEKNFDIWKIFSQEPLTQGQLNKFFKIHENINVIDWLAYPQYSTKQRHDTFVLHKNLYHINAIEWAASAMEMSVIGAKNVALLAYKRWNNIKEMEKQMVKEEL